MYKKISENKQIQIKRKTQTYVIVSDLRCSRLVKYL